MTSFIAVNINADESSFDQATVTIKYTNSMVEGIKAPYTVYKYTPESNNYIAIPSTVNNNDQTITVTLHSLNDPVLAIGGTQITSGGAPVSTWILIVIVIIIVILINVFIFHRQQH